ncbi:hypothetical protein STEG23_008627 [Scotinomys teguina]
MDAENCLSAMSIGEHSCTVQETWLVPSSYCHLFDNRAFLKSVLVFPFERLSSKMLRDLCGSQSTVCALLMCLLTQRIMKTTWTAPILEQELWMLFDKLLEWDENALLVRLPNILLMLLKAQVEYPVYLYRSKRDFDIMASIVAAIAVSAAAATAAGIAMPRGDQFLPYTIALWSYHTIDPKAMRSPDQS